MSSNSSSPGVSRLLVLLSLCSFLVGWDSLVTVPLAPEIAGSFGVDTGNVGWLVSAYALAYLVSAPVSGMVSDRIGRRPLLLLGMIVLGASTGMMFCAPGWGSVLALRFVAGIGAGITQPGVYDLEVGAISTVLMLAGAMSAAGSWIGGRVVDRIGARAVGIASGALAVAGVILMTQAPWDGSAGTIASHLVWSGAFAAGMTGITAIVSSLSERARGTVLSLNSSAMYAGSLVFTGVAPAILRWVGFGGLGFVSAAALVASVSLVLATTKLRSPVRPRWGTAGKLPA